MNTTKKQTFRFLSAQTISLFGSSIVQYAIIWYITLSTSSGKMLTLSTLCAFLPQIIVSLFAGVWIDRYDRKTMIILPDCLIAISTLALAVAFFSGFRPIWFLYVVLVIRSAGTGIQTPAVQAFLPQITEQEQLMRMNGIHSTLSSLTMFLSPVISGAILSVAPLEAALFIDVITAVIGIAITASIHAQPLKSEQKHEGGHDLKAGLSYIKDHRFVRNLLLYQMIILFLISPSAFLTPLLVTRSFGHEVWYLTASEMTYSFGMVIGGVLISIWQGFPKRIHTTLLAGVFYGVLMIGIGGAPWFWLYLLFNMIIGITSPCYNTPMTVTIQEKVDPQYHGRVFSFMQISTSCALPLGMVLFGPLADHIAIPILLIISGVMVIGVSCFVWFTRIFSKEILEG